MSTLSEATPGADDAPDGISPHVLRDTLPPLSPACALNSVRDSCEGIRKISALSSLYVHPALAAALGVLLGVVLTFVSERAASLVTPADPMRGLALVAAMMGARFMVSLLALSAFYFFAREALVPFGLALAVSFVAGLFVEAVRVSRPHAFHTSA